MRKTIKKFFLEKKNEIVSMTDLKTRSTLSLFFALVFAVAGCGSARPSKYYQLTPPGSSTTTSAQDALQVTLILGPIYTSHLYREDRIVYSSEAQQMGTYETERWSEPPVEMFRDVLVRKLRSSGRYRDVNMMRSGGRGDFVLRGRLYDFKEITGKSFAARLSFELQMQDTKTNGTVWTHVYNHDEPVAGKDVASVVAALDRNVQRAASEVAASLEEYFSAHPPAAK